MIVIGCMSMSLTFFLSSRTSVQKVWAAFCVSVGIWGFGAFMIGQVPDAGNALLWWRLAYLGVVAIPVLYVHFILVFLNERRRLLLVFLYAATALFLVADLLPTPIFIGGVHQMFGTLWYLSPTPLYNVFVFYFALVIAYGASLLVLRLTHGPQGEIERAQVILFLIATVIGFGGGAFSFLPEYGISIYPYCNMAVALYPLITGYAVYRHQFLNLRMRIIGAQFMVVVFWLIILVRSLYTELRSAEQYFNMVLLVGAGLIGIYLVRAVIHEQENREKGERLARYLANANARLREIDKQKTEFVSLASHELRSPIAAIKGYSSMVLDGTYGEIPDHLHEPLNRILESGKRIALMVDDFLNVSRIEQGRMVYDMQRVELSTLVRVAVEELQVIADTKQLTLTVECPNEEVYVPADECKLKQVISNLLDNAIKYTPAGSVRVVVEVLPVQHAALVRVIDTGIGVAPEDVDKLFHKFQRAPNANTATVYGTGLGLYIAREIVRAHNGWIQVASDGVGKGSAFTVELPLAAS